MSAQVEPATALASGAPPAPAGPIAGTAFKALMVIFVAVGVIGFALSVGGANAARAWQAYLVNLLVCLGVAQGGVVMLGGVLSDATELGGNRRSIAWRRPSRDSSRWASCCSSDCISAAR